MSGSSLDHAKQQTLQALSPHGIRGECEVRGVKFVGGPSANGWLSCHAVDREDKSPSAAINVSGSSVHLGRYRDLGGEGKSLSFWDLMAHLSPGEFSDWYHALKHFAGKVGIALPNGAASGKKGKPVDGDPASPPEPSGPDADSLPQEGLEEQFDLVNWLNDSPVHFYLLTRGLCQAKAPMTDEGIRTAGGKMVNWPAKSSTPYSCVALPAYRGLKMTSPSGYALLWATGKEFPAVVGKNGEAILPKRKVHLLKGSVDGWIIVGSRETFKAASVVWKVEGPSDALALSTVLPEGHIAVTNSHGAQAAAKCPLGIFKGKRVYVVGDRDEPGEIGAAKFASVVAKASAEVRLIELPYTVEKSHGKDVRDFLLEGNSFEQLLTLAESAPLVAEETPLGELTDLPVKSKAFETDSVDVARDFVKCLEVGDGLSALRLWRGVFWEWNGGHYSQLTDREMKARIWQFTDTRCTHITRSSVGNVMQAVEGLTLLDGRSEMPSWLGTAPPFNTTEIIATKSALIHLPSLIEGVETFSIAPSPAYFSASASEVTFDPDAPQPLEWLQFLESIWPDHTDQDQIATLQEWFGYSLTADTRLQKILLLLGPSRSGKGTIARILKEIVGKASTAGPTLASLATRFGLSPLVGKTLAIVSDARLSGRTDQAVVTERLLSISGEDGIDIDRKNLEPLVSVTLPTRFAILSNEVPKIMDAAGALARRFIILRMRKSFYGVEDHLLIDKLREELPGIMNWAIEGWARLWKRGHFIQPEASQEIHEQLLELTSPIIKFIREKCILNPEAEIPAIELFDEWKSWNEGENRKSGDQSTFGRNLNAAFPEISKSRPRVNGQRVWFYQGIRMRNHWDDVEDDANSAQSGPVGPGGPRQNVTYELFTENKGTFMLGG